METPVLRFNEKGIQKFSRLMDSMKREEYEYKGSQGTPISAEQIKEIKQLASDTELTEDTKLGQIDSGKIFSNRFEMGKYLSQTISYEAHYKDSGLWAWISCLYFDQLLKPKDGEFLLGSEYRYIPENGRLRYYRHLVRMACMVYQKYGETSKIFLSIECHTHSDFVEQSQKAKMLNNQNMIDLCQVLFYDEEKKALKSGVSTNKKQPGSFRRLVSAVTEQLYMNYDLFEMDSNKISEILPSEFEKWKTG